MIIAIEPASGVPPYVQIQDQVARMIGSGVLASGARLPTIQQLATDLELAPGTVARAYKELERDGLVVSRRRKGTVVAERAPTRPIDEIDVALEELVERFALGVHQLGADPSVALDHARRVLTPDVVTD